MAKDSSGTLLLLGAAGVGVYGYLNGWFSQFGFAPASVAVAPAGTAASAAAQAAAALAAKAASGSSSPGPTVPAFGTIVHSLADVAAQAAAKDLYIIPDAATISQAPSGYTLVGCSDKTACPGGALYVRNDVATALMNSTNAVLSATAQATGVPATLLTLQTLYSAPVADLTGIQAAIKAGGLSGLGEFARHVYTRTGYYA